jgi:hypothetical protein
VFHHILLVALVFHRLLFVALVFHLPFVALVFYHLRYVALVFHARYVRDTHAEAVKAQPFVLPEQLAAKIAAESATLKAQRDEHVTSSSTVFPLAPPTLAVSQAATVCNAFFAFCNRLRTAPMLVGQ